MPNLGISMPKVEKGPDYDLSVSKTDADINSPEAKADVQLQSAKVDVKEPEIDQKVKDVKHSPSKFKMPSFKFPKFGAASTNISVEMPEVDKEMTFDGELNIPEATVDITAPNVEIERPSIDLERIGVDGTGKGSTFKMPNLGISIPKVKGPDGDVPLSKPDVDITLPEAKAEMILPEVKVPSAKVEVNGREMEMEIDMGEGKASAPSTTLKEEDAKMKKPWFSLPIFSSSKQSVKETDIQSPKLETELNAAEGSGVVTGHLVSPNFTAEVVKQNKEMKTSEPNRPVDIKIPSHDIKTGTPSADSKHPDTASPVNGSPSKFKLPSFKMPRLSISKAKPEDHYVPVDTECEDDQFKIKQEPEKSLVDRKPAPTNEEMAVPKKHIMCQPQNKDDTEAKQNVKLPAFDLSPTSEVTKTDTDTDGEFESVRSPVDWFKFPRFGLSSPPEKSPESPDEDPSTACSLQSSDAFADASSTTTSEQTGVSFTSHAKVTVQGHKVTDAPDAVVKLGEVHSNIITSTTRSAHISFEPNLPQKITILSSGVSSSSVDTLKLESDQIHVVRSNVQAKPQVLQSTTLTDFQVQSPFEISMDPEFREAVSWSVGEPQQYQGITSVERHITREMSSQETTVSRGTVVITQQITRRLDMAEPISDDTASSIQRLRDTVHSEKMRFFEGAQP
ncbi:hypothetical protein NHX12_020005 [Muraenolepis orangiensis]|uniref:Uncharacterized protein n=1 Tax=Muraenolepis orangiensis TaxID=630683 RepID=A0A9Q0EV21_9TELE|nr:hypothetical protein NHX12_020005 [Muraenolepis orangiensis]